jgi:MFS family permease
MPRPKLHYAWIVAATTFLVLIVTAAIRSTPGVLIVPLEHAFGWKVSAISLAISINILLYGLMGPFAAGIVNRYGVRRVLAGAYLLMAAGIALSFTMTKPWQLALYWGVLVGAGTGMGAIVLGASVVNRWFHARRGLVLGALTASSATGQLLFLPLLAHLAETRGWRAPGYALLGVIVLMIPLVVLLMRDDPADVGLRSYGWPENEPAPAARLKAGLHAPGNPFADAISALMLGIRHPGFWLLAGSFFVCGASTNGLIGTHLIPACVDHGMTEVQGAGLLALMGLFDLVGTTASGWLSDRYSNRMLLAVYYGFRGLALLFLPSAFDPQTHKLSIFAIFYGLDWIATVPPTVALAAEMFGRDKAPVIFGWVVVAHQIGAACATTVAGFIRSTLGSYDLAFVLSGTICVATAIAVLTVGRRREGLSPLPFALSDS